MSCFVLVKCCYPGGQLGSRGCQEIDQDSTPGKRHAPQHCSKWVRTWPTLPTILGHHQMHLCITPWELLTLSPSVVGKSSSMANINCFWNCSLKEWDKSSRLKVLTPPYNLDFNMSFHSSMLVAVTGLMGFITVGKMFRLQTGRGRQGLLPQQTLAEKWNFKFYLL